LLFYRNIILLGAIWRCQSESASGAGRVGSRLWAPPQTSEFSALVPRWLSKYDATSSRLCRVGGKFREGYSDRWGWPGRAEAAQPTCHPAAPLETKGPITFASPHGKPNLRKKACGGGKNREPFHLGEQRAKVVVAEPFRKAGAIRSSAGLPKAHITTRRQRIRRCAGVAKRPPASCDLTPPSADPALPKPNHAPSRSAGEDGRRSPKPDRAQPGLSIWP